MPQDLLYLSRQEIVSLGLEMRAIVAAVEDAFLQKAAGLVEMPPKPGIHTRPDSFLHAMPAYVKSQEAAGMKWVAGYPGNQNRGLPYISGLFILNDAATGFPLAVMDATWITAMRTAAATAVAARYLATRTSKSVAILGCGVQGRSNVAALAEVLSELKQVFAYDIREDAAQRFGADCLDCFGIPATVCESPEQAVRNADVIVTAGPIVQNPSPVIIRSWLRDGAFICTLDFDSYVTNAAFEGAGMFVTDDLNPILFT